MKSQCSTALTAYLNWLCTSGNGGSYCVIDLYTIVLADGTTLRWAAWALPIAFPATGIYAPGSSVGGNTRVSGQTFSATQGYVDRSKLSQALKLEVSQIKVTVRATPLMQINGTPVLAAIAAGKFGGAQIYVDRLFAQNATPGRSWVDWLGNPQTGFDYSLGTLNWFTGGVAEVEEVGRSHAVLSAKDPTAYLSDQHPRNLYLTGCRHNFGDAGCAFNKSSVQQSGAVTVGSTTVSINTNLTQSDQTLTPPALPGYTILTSQQGVNLPASTYYVVVTFTGPGGESAASPELAVSVTGGGTNGTTNSLLKVNAPSSHPANATGWNIYVGLSPGNEQLQASFNGFTGPNASWQQVWPLGMGAPPPEIATQGYFAAGSITFTSGANSGITRSITAYSNPGSGGVVTIAPPLPTAPAAGDTFTIVPDCDNTMAMCQYRYNNLIHFAGQPFLPAPEMSV